MRKSPVVVALAAGCVLGWGADWLTDGGDSKRTAWQKDEKILSTANVKDIKLLWKIKLDNEPRQMHYLFPPLIVEKVNTPSGVRNRSRSRPAFPTTSTPSTSRRARSSGRSTSPARGLLRRTADAAAAFSAPAASPRPR